MSIASTKKRVKEVITNSITDLDHIDMINEKGLYLILEGIRGNRVYFGLYLAHKTLRNGLAGTYTELDSLLKEIKQSDEVCGCIELVGVNLSSFSDRLFIYHIKISVLDTGE